MCGDARRHFRITGFSRGDVNAGSVMRGQQLFGIAAFARASAADHQSRTCRIRRKRHHPPSEDRSGRRRGGLLASGQGQVPRLPGDFRRQWRVRNEYRTKGDYLAVYSCGGSAGLTLPNGARHRFP